MVYEHKKKLRVGIIGCGEISKARHIPYYLQNKNVELVAVCDINPEVLEKFNMNTYIDYREMLSKENLDMIDIATPPFGHVEQSIDCLEAGCDILVEKPFTFSLEECDKVLAVARKHNKNVCVVHSSLFFPSMQKALRLVDKLGNIKVIRIQYDATLDKHVLCNDWIVKMPAGAFHEQMPHVSYLIRNFIKPESADVYTSKIGSSSLLLDHYSIILREEGKTCNVDIYYGKNWKVEIVLIGDKKQMYIDLLNQYVRITSLRDREGPISILWNCFYQILTRILTLGENFISFFKPFGHRYIINTYVDFLLNGTPTPITMDEVRETVRITEMVIRECLKNSDESDMEPIR